MSRPLAAAVAEATARLESAGVPSVAVLRVVNVVPQVQDTWVTTYSG